MDRWGKLSLAQKADLMGLYISKGVRSLKDIKYHYNRLDGNNPKQDLDIGGYSKDSREGRKGVFMKWDPTGGIYIPTPNNKATGEESLYYSAYLGLHDKLPKSNVRKPDDLQDDKDLLEQGYIGTDYYSTTPRMDVTIQALADTLNLGKIYRNYDYYKEKHPTLAPKVQIKRAYKKGKELLDNPNEWVQINSNNLGVVNTDGDSSGESNPLGMLGKFGMRWSPEDKSVYIHDRYDFPSFPARVGGVPDRPRVMKIRSKIGFDPNRGSRLLRNDLSEFETAFPERIKLPKELRNLFGN